MESCLTNHARLRLGERNSLTENALLQIIDTRRYVIVGIEPYSNRLHKLLYSKQDEDHFVAIQDTVTGEVITILPLPYHENLAWKISPKKLKQAVLLISPRSHDSINPPKEVLTPEGHGVKCSISLVLASSGTGSKKKSLGEHRFNERPEVADDALCDTGFVEKVLMRLRKLKVPFDFVEEILLYGPKQDFFLKLPWNTLERFEDDLGASEDNCEETSFNFAAES